MHLQVKPFGSYIGTECIEMKKRNDLDDGNVNENNAYFFHGKNCGN